MRRRLGFTLIELTVAAGVSAIVLTLVVSTLAFALRQTARVGSQASVAIAFSNAVERMRPTIVDSYLCSAVSVGNGTTGLQCDMPDTTYSSNYAPYRVDTSGAARYRAGASYLFYKSDSTGSLSANGNCLWRATKASGASVFTPDSAWSKYYSTGTARVCGITALTFAVDQTNHKVTMTLSLSESYGGSALKGANTAGSETTTIVRRFYYRNWK
jgi:hypothetical protein